MFTQKKPELHAPERITIVIRDDNGSPRALVAFGKNDILETTFMIVTGELVIKLKSYQEDGGSFLQHVVKTRPKTGGNGQVAVEKLPGSYEQHMFTQQKGQHDSIVTRDRDEIKKIWNFIDADITYDEVIQMHDDEMEKIQKARDEASKKAAEEANAAKQQEGGKIVNVHGEPIQS